MAIFHDVKLEIIRPGPPHNQLLSPLTPYMALCGEGSPITFHIGLEHRQLLNRLERLRYVVAGAGGNPGMIPERLREAEVMELGEKVAEILAQIRNLNGELSRAQRHGPDGSIHEDQEVIHLRILFSGSELAIIPFEMAVAPQAFPGEGLEFCLQTNLPIVVTREIRRSRPLPTPWDRSTEPRVLFVSAAPEGMGVPAAAHVQALRAALEPWIRWPEPAKPGTETEGVTPEQRRLPFIKDRLRLFVNASIEDIYQACSTQAFTHIHILAHGDHYEEAGEQRFGLALCRQGRPGEKQVVSGKRLAKALQAEHVDGVGRSQPTVVTLATCDAGNPGSILVPGGSIAHDLHSAGIPWVFASQFPLTKAGSVRMTEALYPRLLRGDDPRAVLYELRRQLYRSADRDHDWASLVAYAALPENFSRQVVGFFERQTRRAIEIGLDRADNAAGGKDAQEERERALETTKGYLARWRKRLPAGDSVVERAQSSECYGMHGSTFKRIALQQFADQQHDAGCRTLQASLDYYRRALGDSGIVDDMHHWNATQCLSLEAILQQTPDPVTYRFTRQVAQRALESRTGSAKAWAHGTLAELELLGIYHSQAENPVQASAKLPAESERQVIKKVTQHCQAIVALMGADSFHVASTRRQFERYRDYWDRPVWDNIVRAALAALSPADGPPSSNLPPYA